MILFDFLIIRLKSDETTDQMREIAELIKKIEE